MKLTKLVNNRNMNKTVNLLLKSEWVLYVVICVAIVELISFVKLNNHTAIIVFMASCLGMTLVTKSKQLILFVALIITNVVGLLNIKSIPNTKVLEGAKFSRRDSNRSLGDIFRCIVNCITNEKPCPQSRKPLPNGLEQRPGVSAYQEGFEGGEESFVDSQPKALSGLNANQKRLKKLTQNLKLPQPLEIKDTAGAKKQIGIAKNMMTKLSPMIDDLEKMLSSLETA